MSLEGLRAWIGEVERKLGKRTRVFLALSVIAIGLGGAAIYLAVDARESSVSESDVQGLQEELEAQIDEAATGAAAGTAAPVEPEPEATPGTEAEPAPEAQPKPKADGKGTGAPKSGTAGDGGGDSAADGSTDSTGGAEGPSATGAAGGAKIQDLLEQAEEQSSEAEQAQGGN